jgi:hypothetical protein
MGNKTGEGPSQAVLAAVGNVLWLAAGFAIFAAIAAWLRSRPGLEPDS